MDCYNIYTDGSCFPNPNGFGGWAFAVVSDKNIIKYFSGCEKRTTNNRMELTAILKALEWIDRPYCKIYSDSQYCVNSIAKWYAGWDRSNKLDSKANIDLISESYYLYRDKKADIIWVRGHSGNEYNEFVDELANQEMLDLYKEVNGVALTEDFILTFMNTKKEHKTQKKEKFFINNKKQKETQTIKVETQNPQNILTITTNKQDDKYIIINGVKYKKLKKQSV